MRGFLVLAAARPRTGLRLQVRLAIALRRRRREEGGAAAARVMPMAKNSPRACRGFVFLLA